MDESLDGKFLVPAELPRTRELVGQGASISFTALEDTEIWISTELEPLHANDFGAVYQGWLVMFDLEDTAPVIAKRLKIHPNKAKREQVLAVCTITQCII